MYSEDDAIKYIRTHAGEDVTSAYDDDELLNIVDMIWDYYEANGMLDVDFDEEDDEDEDSPEQLLDSLVEYASRMLRKDKEARIAADHLRPIIAAELEYEDSLL